MENPKILYHASPNNGLEELTPRNIYPRYEGEENLVFATPYKAIAAMFLTPRDLTSEIGKYGDKYVIFINASKRVFDDADQGGTIYEVAPDLFTTDYTIGMKETEWVSRVVVRPIASSFYKTSFDAMDQAGVKIYFVEKNETYEKIKNDPANALNLV